MTGTFSSRQISTRCAWFPSNTRFTPNGRLVSVRVSRIALRVASRLFQVKASIPSPPALDMLAANSGQLALPIGAWIIGRSTLSKPTSGVRSAFITGISHLHLEQHQRATSLIQMAIEPIQHALQRIPLMLQFSEDVRFTRVSKHLRFPAHEAKSVVKFFALRDRHAHIRFSMNDQ